MAWFKKATRVQFVALAAGAQSLVAEQQPSGDITVDVPGSVVRSFSPPIAVQFKEWFHTGAHTVLWLFLPKDADGLSSIEAFLRGNIVKIVATIKGDSQILVAHVLSPTGGMVLCAGGEFSSTPEGFRRFRVKAVGGHGSVEEL